VSRTSTHSAGSPSRAVVRRVGPAARLLGAQTAVAAATAAAIAPAAATVPAAAVAAAVTAAAVAAVAATAETAVPARCSRQPALPAAARPRSRSARPAASPFIARTASAASAADPATKSILSARAHCGLAGQRDQTRVVSRPGSFVTWRASMAVAPGRPAATITRAEARITLPRRAYGAICPRRRRQRPPPFGCALRDATRTIDPHDPPAHPVPLGPGNAAMNAAILRLPD
jgi:hypothetical protein